MPQLSHVTFKASGEPPIRLEGQLHRPDREAATAGACLLLHPHPMFGGSMDVWLLSRVAGRLASEGWTVLRLNFRGVGASEGESSDGSGEVLDALGALAFLDEVTCGAGSCHRRAVVGWSFGALVGLLLAKHAITVSDWVGIGPPTRRLKALPIVDPPYRALPGWRARRCVIVGEFDQLYPPGSVAVLDPDVVHVVPGADHFMADRYEEVADVVSRALRRPEEQ
ncbi:MAG: alpha/beta hydrolase [Egibacteraceae bacterium]